MDELAYRRFDILQRDMPKPVGFHVNFGKRRLHEALGVGSRLWLVSGLKRSDDLAFVLLACLVVAREALNPPAHAYGRYGVVGDPVRSRYFSPDGPDMTDEVLRRLSFVGDKPIGPAMARKNTPMALRSMRSLTPVDARTVEAWADRLASIATTSAPPAA